MNLNVLTQRAASQQISLSGVYDLPHFPALLRHVSCSTRFPKHWRDVLGDIDNEANVLEIGGGTGRLTRELVDRCESLHVVERNREFYPSLQTTVKRAPTRAHEVLLGSFPDRVTGQYDVVCLYQNVFIELINQLGLTRTVRELRRVTRSNGLLLFDYPSCDQVPPVQGIQSIYSGHVPAIGDVEYSYALLDACGDLYEALLRYDVHGMRQGEYHMAAQLAFLAPNIHEVLQEVSRRYGRVELMTLPDAATFYPGEMFLVKSKGR